MIDRLAPVSFTSGALFHSSFRDCSWSLESGVPSEVNIWSFGAKFIPDSWAVKLLAGCYLGEVKVNGDAEQNFQEFVLLRVKAIEDSAESLRNSQICFLFLNPWLSLFLLLFMQTSIEMEWSFWYFTVLIKTNIWQQIWVILHHPKKVWT